ncbi:hypothetical protein PF001_g8028 [Phytophthora fragariae]|uniref:Uncharacterized protein n=2 Tax=Phytophthora fragariae TaxID=53985 RepID=A0A6A4DVG2_9STRA|nr:hypothetical protein PF009_g9835 [Phytophthora fragariae]KAE9314985.1 hypothetical protein PF001_g8028 [Phytophthora fragariae]
MCSPATVLAHLTSLSNRWRVTEIQAGQAPPRRGYEDLLTRPVQAGEPAEDGVRNQHALEQAFLVEQESYLRDLFNQTLPHGYMTQLSTPLASQPVPAFWQQLEVDFGQNNAMGMVDMIQEFEAALAMDFGSEAELFQRIRSVRNRLNRQVQETLRMHLIPSQLMSGKVLSLLPSQLWGPSVTFSPEEFTLEKVERKMIQAMGKPGEQMNPVSVPVNYPAKGTYGDKKGPSKKSDKRKAAPLPMDDERVNACFYCNDVHNGMNGIGSHFKRDCPKRKADMANGVGRKDIFSEPRPLKMRKTDHARVQKMQPAQATARKEIPVDAAALQRLNISDETPRQSDGDVPTTPGSYDMVSTDGRSTPPSPAVSSSAAGDSDEDMDEFDRHKVTPANSVAVLSVAEELEEKAQAFEEKDAGTD